MYPNDRPPTHVSRGTQRLVALLRERGSATASEVAAALGIGVVAARARLRILEAGGLAERSLVRRPLGRPVARFALTSGAEPFFPKRYEELAEHLLDAIEEEWGAEAVERVFQRWEDRLHAALDATLPKEPKARLGALAAHQNKHGFMATSRADSEGVALIERSCPVLAIATRHPAICRHEAALFGRTLGWRTALESCQATGDTACVFRIGRAPARGEEKPPRRNRDGKE